MKSDTTLTTAQSFRTSQIYSIWESVGETAKSYMSGACLVVLRYKALGTACVKISLWKGHYKFIAHGHKLFRIVICI